MLILVGCSEAVFELALCFLDVLRVHLRPNACAQETRGVKGLAVGGWQSEGSASRSLPRAVSAAATGACRDKRQDNVRLVARRMKQGTPIAKDMPYVGAVVVVTASLASLRMILPHWAGRSLGLRSRASIHWTRPEFEVWENPTWLKVLIESISHNQLF